MKPAVMALAVLALGAMPTAQSTSLDSVPIVGHWEQQTSGPDTIVTADATRWAPDRVAD